MAQRSAAPGPPDTVVVGARVHTMDAGRPIVESFAITDGTISVVGDRHDVLGLADGGTQVVDLRGSSVVPGLIDVHNHHLVAGEADLHHLHVAPTASLEEVLRAVRERVASTPDGDWILGGIWGSPLIDELSRPESLAALDVAASGRPVLLTDDSHHNRWANTAAMRSTGLLDLIDDPEGGRVVRDAAGRPTGLLIEAAGALVEMALARTRPLDVEHHARSSARGIQMLHEHGITAFQDAAAGTHTMAALRALDERGELTAWVVTSMLVNDLIFGTEVVGDELLVQGEGFRTRHHRPDFAKIFLDGVPPSRTGAFLEPYLPDEAHGSCHLGATTITPAELDSWLVRARELRLGVKIHCTGDAAVRVVLDAVEAAEASGRGAPRVQIAHGQYVHPDDIARFARLGVVADISPALWFPGVIVDALRTVLPEPRASRIQPNRALLDAGAVVAAGSDWPVAESPNPWPAIYGLVTRQDPTRRFPGELWPEQAITRREAVAAHTSAAATAIGLDDVTGRLRVGLSADFVVLSDDPFDVPVQELAGLRAEQTWFAGAPVHTV